MDYVEKARAFRVETSAIGLVTEGMINDPDRRFGLDINQGWINVPADPLAILMVVGYERKYELNVMLALVARRSDLSGFAVGKCKSVCWQRSYHVPDSGNSAVWVSLKDWLAEQGHPVPADQE